VEIMIVTIIGITVLHELFRPNPGIFLTECLFEGEFFRTNMVEVLTLPKSSSISSGNGNTIVEFFSAAISESVW